MMDEWIPKTNLGRMVRNHSINDINEILDNGYNILEPEIVDMLLPDMKNDLLLIGQSKGKFGGGRRRVFRQTQKKTREGNKPRFAAYAVIGNKDGIVGLGYGKARETVPARDKAIRAAKLNVFKIARGSGSWEGRVDEPHTVPFTVEGRCGSVRIRLMPAPKGKGLIAEKEVQKILSAAGIMDVWSKTFGQTKNKINLVKATEKALRKLITMRVREKDASSVSLKYGTTKPRAVVADNKQNARPKAAKKTVKVTNDAESAPANAKEVSLTQIPGVGPAKAKKLTEAGFTDASSLVSAGVEVIVAKLGYSESAAKKLVDSAVSALEDLV